MNQNYHSILFIAAFAVFSSISSSFAEEVSGKAGADAESPSSEETTKDVAVKQVMRSDVVYRINLGRASDVAMFLKQGVSPNEINDSGVPFLALAAGRTDSEGISIVKVLAEAGADVNKVDKRGRNALFYAARVGNKVAVEYLLSKEINYTSPDASGTTVRNVAFQAGHNEIVEMLDNFVREQNKLANQKIQSSKAELKDQYAGYKAAVEVQAKKNIDTIKQSGGGKVADLVHEAAFSSCASLYWKFCMAIKQPTELSSQGLANNSNIQQNHAKEAVSTLLKEYHINPETASSILSISGDKITNELLALRSNEIRSDAGVGTIEDMTKRCQAIANTWSTSTGDTGN